MPHTPNEGMQNAESQHVLPERHGVVDPKASAAKRMQSIAKHVDGLRSDVDRTNASPFRQMDQMLNRKGLEVVQVIEEKVHTLRQAVEATAAEIDLKQVGSQARETLSSILPMLRDETLLHTVPYARLINALVMLGKANKDNEDPAVQAEVDELRSIVLRLQNELKKQGSQKTSSVVPTVVVNNNFGPQGSPQAPAAQAPEKKEEQRGWEEEGQELVRQVVSINQRIKTLKQEHDQRSTPFDPVAEKAFKDEVDGLVNQRKQLLRSVNAVVDNARNPSADRNQVAVTREQSELVMNRWINAMPSQDRGSLQIKNGAFKVI